jgi:hypothetical protein
MIDDSEGLGTPHEAFCRIVAVIHPENPGLGKKVTGPHWHYELPRDSRDALACGNALGFLAANVSAGKISAQGIRKGTEHDGPKPINTAELRTGILKVWDGTLECRTDGEGGRLYRSVFLSMADLNRAIGAPATKGKGGRKPIVDWGVVFVELERLMDHHNEFSPDDPEWNAQARLVEALQKFCSDKFGIEPDKNTIEGRIKEPLSQWREQKAKHPET